MTVCLLAPKLEYLHISGTEIAEYVIAIVLFLWTRHE